MDKIEMMVGYEVNFFEKKFNENVNKISNYMYACLKESIGDKIAGFAIEENLLHAWAYYFVTIADEEPAKGDKLMRGLIIHFKNLIEDKDRVKIHGEANAKLMLDTTFTRIWFGTNLNVMLANKYGSENYERAFSFIQQEYLSKETKVKSLMLA